MGTDKILGIYGAFMRDGWVYDRLAATMTFVHPAREKALPQPTVYFWQRGPLPL